MTDFAKNLMLAKLLTLVDNVVFISSADAVLGLEMSAVWDTPATGSVATTNTYNSNPMVTVCPASTVRYIGLRDTGNVVIVKHTITDIVLSATSPLYIDSLTIAIGDA